VFGTGRKYKGPPRGGLSISAVHAAVHEPRVGPKQTSHFAVRMSALGDEADVETQKADVGVSVLRQTSRPALTRSNLAAHPDQ